MRWHVDVPLDRARIRRVTDRRHLETLVPYVLCQTHKHGIDCHPARWPSSCFQDLIGARILPGFDPDTLFRLLPRWNRATIWDAVGLVPPPPPIEAMSLEELCQAARSAINPGAADNSRSGRDANAATLQIAAGLGYGRVEMRRATRLPETTIRRLLRRPIDPRLHRALQQQIRLHRAVAALARRRAA